MATLEQGTDYSEFKSLFRGGFRPVANLNTIIHDEDEMMLFATSVHNDRHRAAQVYFTQGFEMLNLVRQIIEWRFGSMENVRTFLDFACGYGRFTRHLASALPAERIWVSDIYADGVAFLIAQFGVNGIVSTADPEDYVCDQRFDCIYVASLFSHLPADRFDRWLRKLFNLLTPDGILVFSVNDEAILADGFTMPEEGILFIPQSESRSLDKNEYGSTWVAERYMRRIIGNLCGKPENACRLPRGLLNYQDLYLLPAGKTPLPALQIDTGFQGNVELCTLSGPNTLELSGWAVNSSPDDRSCSVQVWIDGKPVQRCVPRRERPDVAQHFKRPEFLLCGWNCSLTWSGNPEEWIVITVHGDSPVDHVIEAGSVHYLLGPRA